MKMLNSTIFFPSPMVFTVQYSCYIFFLFQQMLVCRAVLYEAKIDKIYFTFVWKSISSNEYIRTLDVIYLFFSMIQCILLSMLILMPLVSFSRESALDVCVLLTTLQTSSFLGHPSFHIF